MQIVIVGAGAMGEALLAGWLASGWDVSDIAIVEQNTGRAEDVVQRYGVTRVQLEDAAASSIIVLAVKPDQVLATLRAIEPTRDSLVISVAAGIPLAQLGEAAPEVACVRVMPNTPVLVGEGMAGVAAGTTASADHLEIALGLMRAVGGAIAVPEKLMDAVTAISGSGPAYLFYIAEAMIETGVHLGLSRSDATMLVNQTIRGSAAMLTTSGESATALRERVTSPAGTTAAALAELDDRGVRAAFNAALRAARDRSREMATSAKPR